MNKFNSVVIVALVSFAFFSVPVVYAGAPDVYVVYLAKDKKLGKSVALAIANMLPESSRVKSYNATILLVSDYSGKQKTAARLSKAKLVVFVKGRHSPAEVLDSNDFDNLVQVQSISDEDLAKVRENFQGIE
ncbi:MAG: hypothetical protein COB51_07925 [Moraxellaceae bacterium]|nr:MAG: hypothetical protein COB51_07925 [Moraxellaceae bacterium]